MESREAINIANLKQYLLGSLPQSEVEVVELSVISGEISEDELLWAESELMEDYLDETLSPTEVEMFKENFLVSPERAAQLRQISLIKNYVRDAAAKKVPEKTRQTVPESFAEKLRNFFSINWRPAIAVFSLLIVGFLAVLYFTLNDQTASEKEFAALNQKDLSDLAQFESLANLSLTHGTFRDSGGVRKLAENQLTEKVLFRLALPVQSNAPDKFKAELVKDGRVVFTQSNLAFYNNPNGQEIRLLLPASQLKKGTYQIKLAKDSAPESVFVYNFAVE